MVNVGIDLHKTQFTICARIRQQERFEAYPTTDEGYAAFLKKAAAWQKAGHEVRVGVESTGNTRYFKARMEAAGIGVTVINTLKFKVVNESVKKTDKHDAATIAEFLEKDMLPQSRLCSRESEQVRRLLKARTTLVRAKVVIKNQIHALLVAEGLEDARGTLQSKRGRKRILDTLNERANGLVVQPLLETIDGLDEQVKALESHVREVLSDDWMVKLLLGIPGCGEISAWTIRAYTDDIGRFSSAKKYSAYAGLVPWVSNSNETVRHGKITKRGPEELRTALVQVVMGFIRLKKRTMTWRLMENYAAMKKGKGSGKSIIAAARKVSVIVWHMLSGRKEFDAALMVGNKPAKLREEPSAALAREAAIPVKPPKVGGGKPALERQPEARTEKPGVAGEKRKKAG